MCGTQRTRDLVDRKIRLVRAKHVGGRSIETVRTIGRELVDQKLPIELLQRHITQVKTGLPGMAHVKLDPGVPWPERLERNLVR